MLLELYRYYHEQDDMAHRWHYHEFVLHSTAIIRSIPYRVLSLVPNPNVNQNPLLQCMITMNFALIIAAGFLVKQ